MLRDRQVMAAFDVFWPKGARFPPSLPWLGARLSRGGAYSWISSFPETARRIAQAPSYQAIADFVSWSLFSDDADGERKKKCKKDGPRDSSGELSDTYCQSPKFQSFEEAEQWIHSNCPSNASLGQPDGAVIMADGMFCAKCLPGGSSGGFSSQVLPEY